MTNLIQLKSFNDFLAEAGQHIVGANPDLGVTPEADESHSKAKASLKKGDVNSFHRHMANHHKSVSNYYDHEGDKKKALAHKQSAEEHLDSIKGPRKIDENVEILSEATFNHGTDASAHHQSAEKSKKLGNMKEYHSSMADAHTAAESHYNDLGNHKMAEHHAREADAHLLKAGAAVNIREDAILEGFETLFEDNSGKESVSKAHAALANATDSLKNKDIGGFHNSMSSYHTSMAKHHTKFFSHHLEQASKNETSGNKAEAARHNDLAWGHSDAYDHHKRLAHTHSIALKKRGKLLKEEFQAELNSLAESLSPAARDDAAQQQARSAGAAADAASNLIDKQAAASKNGGAVKPPKPVKPKPLGPTKPLNEDGEGMPASNSAASDKIAQKPMPLGPLQKRKSAINEAKIPGGNPATVPPAAPTMSKSNDSLPSKRKSLGKLKESADDTPSEYESLDESTKNNYFGNHAPSPHIESEHHDIAMTYRSSGKIKEFHQEMSKHHASVAEKLSAKSKEALKNGFKAGAEAHQAQADKSKAHVDWHASRAMNIVESLDNTMLEDIHRSATYASVAAKHKFKVKGPNQTHVFNHEDHGTVTVNREKDTWEHNATQPNSREKPKVTSGSGADALDSHLRKNATQKQVHI